MSPNPETLWSTHPNPHPLWTHLAMPRGLGSGTELYPLPVPSGFGVPCPRTQTVLRWDSHDMPMGWLPPNNGPTSACSSLPSALPSRPLAFVHAPLTR